MFETESVSRDTRNLIFTAVSLINIPFWNKISQDFTSSVEIFVQFELKRRRNLLKASLIACTCLLSPLPGHWSVTRDVGSCLHCLARARNSSGILPRLRPGFYQASRIRENNILYKKEKKCRKTLKHKTVKVVFYLFLRPSCKDKLTLCTENIITMQWV